jgi:hypothetical protein
MKLSAPKKIVFYVSLVLIIAGLLGFFITTLADFQLWFVLAGYVLLALGNLLKGF